MLKGFKTKDIILIVLLAVFMFIVDLLIVAPINTISGVHGMGFLIDVIFINALVTVSAIILKRFFSMTLLSTLYGVLVIPTMIMGPPTPFKVILGVMIGITADIVIWIFRYKKIGFILGVAIANAISYPVGYYIGLLLGVPGTEELGKVVWFLTLAVLLLGILGDWLGILLYNRIKDKTLVRQLEN
jgi:hypothetical protein